MGLSRCTSKHQVYIMTGKSYEYQLVVKSQKSSSFLFNCKQQQLFFFPKPFVSKERGRWCIDQRWHLLTLLDICNSNEFCWASLLLSHSQLIKSPQSRADFLLSDRYLAVFNLLVAQDFAYVLQAGFMFTTLCFDYLLSRASLRRNCL